jgi:heme-degrading monooxygenase HmoA
MISRIWHGWTSHQNADVYEKLLKEEIIVGIQARNIKGFKSIQLLQRRLDQEVEFVTIMLFDDLDAVREFAGADHEACVVPEKARAVLAHFDQRSRHYDVLLERQS